MNFFRRVELKLNYSAAANFEKPEKVHKTRKNRPKTGGFMANLPLVDTMHHAFEAWCIVLWVQV